MFSFRKGDKNPDLTVTITTETYVRLALLTVATIILLLAIKKAAPALTLILIAFFLALALNAPVHWLSERLPGKRRGSRVLATSISFLVVVLILGAFIASIVPPLIRQTQNFIDAAPRLVRDIQRQDSAVGQFIRQYDLQDRVNEFSGELANSLSGTGSAAVSALGRIGSSVISVLTVLVLTFMMLVEGPRWLALGREMTPDRHRGRSDRLLNAMYRVVKGFVNGQVMIAALAAILILPVLLILDLDYPAALMVIVFLGGLIPMVGQLISGTIVTLVALFQSVPTALIVLAYYILYQQFENILIQPRVQANTTNISPLLVFASVIIGVNLGGLLGGIVAIPVAGCLRILVLEFLHEKEILSKPGKEVIATDTK